jgi:hypothetical protein
MTTATNPNLKMPPIFYRYTPIGDWLPGFLKGDSLQFSSRQKFNDPFDCRPGFKLTGGKELDKFLHKKYKKLGFKGADRFKKVSEAKHIAGTVNSFSSISIDSVLDQVGVLCLATEWNNSLMWSHYADHHKGICVGFHSNIDVFKIAFPVAYQDEFPVILRPEDDTDTMFNKGFLRKAKCWEYEREWRIIKPSMPKEDREAEYYRYCPETTVADAHSLSDKRGPGIYRFQKEAISHITLGMRMPPADKEKFFLAFKESKLDIPVYQVSGPLTSYSLSRQVIRNPRP